MTVTVRAYRPDDGPALQRIYADEGVAGTASWEDVAPTVEAFMKRRAELVALGFPCLVAEVDGVVAGWSNASSYRTRPGYRFTVEDSVYVARAHAGKGVGRALLEALIAECAARGFRQMIAVVGDSQNRASIALHERCGFRHIATFQNIGWKFGRWLDSVQLMRPLGAGATTSPE